MKLPLFDRVLCFALLLLFACGVTACGYAVVQMWLDGMEFVAVTGGVGCAVFFWWTAIHPVRQLATWAFRGRIDG